jgi:hypothetical protein
MILLACDNRFKSFHSPSNDASGAANGHRHAWDASLHGKNEASLLELLDHTVVGTCAFGEEEHGPVCMHVCVYACMFMYSSGERAYDTVTGRGICMYVCMDRMRPCCCGAT